jgi:N-acetylglucosaminyldiphosphoundecaprenol N-acetyl-beta-D-mannosaminyltransferase
MEKVDKEENRDKEFFLEHQGTRANSERVNILGLKFDNLSMEESLAVTEEFIRKRTPHQIFTPNAALLVWAHSDPFLRQVYEDSDLVTADGMSILVAGRLLGAPLKERVPAYLLMFRLFDRAEEKGYRFFFVGAKPEVIEKAMINLRRQRPTLAVAGWHHGYFDLNNAEDVVEKIRQSNADVLCVGMSTPLKERFIYKNLQKMNVPVCIGVGGAIDILAGLYKVAPAWMTKVGLEWLYRLIQEPRRLWKRYLTTNSIFVFLLLRELTLKTIRLALPELKRRHI